MRWSRGLGALFAVATALAVTGGAAALTPDRTLVASLPVRDLALTGRTVAYVADAPVRLQCARIGLWNTATNRRFPFDAKEQCLEQGSTGQGVWDVSVATTRLLWLTYAGGNFREWSLWTATTTRRRPRLLRFVARDVDAPPPIVLGPGTAEGIPYAVYREIVYLGDDGRAIFRTTVASPVRALASRLRGRFVIVVAALLADGTVVGLGSGGEQHIAWDPPGTVTALGLDDLVGIAVQVGREISFPGGEVMLPSGAVMVDLAQGRILWTRAGDLGATSVTGKTTRLVDGTPTNPAFGQLDARGAAWARGRAVRWRAGRLP